MNRRKFLTLSVVKALSLPIVSFATDYRVEKPAAWTTDTVDEAIKNLYGDVKLLQSDALVLKMVKVSSNGAQIPISVKIDLDVKSIAIFQDVNPEATVAVFTVHEGMIADFSFKLKWQKVVKSQS